MMKWNKHGLWSSFSWVDLSLSTCPLACLLVFLPKYLLNTCCVTLDKLLYPSETYSSLANWKLAPQRLSCKEPTCNAGDAGSIPGSGRSPGEGNGYPLQLLSWTIPRTEVPGRLQSMGSQRVRHNWVTDHTQKSKQCLLQNWESIRQCICSFNNFCWSIVALQGYISFCCTVKWISYMYTYCYCCSVTKLCRIPCNPWATARQISLSFTISQSLLKLLSTELVMPSNHLILCHPLLHLPSIIPGIRVFSNELAVGIRWPEYWSFSISSSNEYSGLISFRIDWCDLLAVQRTL